MSQAPAPASNPSRQTRRNRKSSGLFTNSVFAIILIVGGTYAIWGIKPLKQAWTSLGFGKHAAGEATVKIQSPNEGLDDANSGGEPKPTKIVPPPPLPLSRMDKSEIDAELESNKFLPQNRLRQNPIIRRPVNIDANPSEVQLDRRFEVEALPNTGAKSNRVRTAEFEETGEAGAPRQMPNPNTRIQFELESGQINADQKQTSGIRQLGGDEDVHGGTAAAPNRSAVKAKQASTVGVPGPLKVQDVQALIDAGNDAEAYQMLASAYTRYPSDRERFQELLDTVARRIYFTPQPQIEPPHEIQPGDQLRKIATKYHMSWQYLSKLNQVDAKKIRPGKKLKVFQGPFNATVDLSDFELVVFLDGKYVKRYKVGTGKDNSSPLGEFIVKEKLENPTYYGPEGNVLAADDPKNPLGERWIDIGNSFGIHGTIEPDSIGKSESAGCIRMRNEDVADVYDLLTVGSTVTIQR